MISHCLKVDFWDTDQMAAKMLAVVNYPALGQCLSENGSSEVDKFSWRESAQKCLSVYGEVSAA
jgi:glycosyltransferase involved in cell wall biosynthesis